MIKSLLKTILIFILTLTFVNCSSNNQNQKVQNLRAFTKLYGYVKYFHPSDEASKINWDKLAIYGVGKVKESKSSTELKNVLDSLFLPIAPTLKIFLLDDPPQKQMSSIPNDTSGLSPIYWQHKGIWLSEKSNIYYSLRVNRTSEKEPDQLFERKPQEGELIRNEIGAGLGCLFPIVLYGDSNKTIGYDNKFPIDPLLSNLDEILFPTLNADLEDVRLANISIAWNVFQHFYPYFDVIDTDWDIALTDALNKSLEDKNSNQFNETLQMMIAKLDDGHGVVFYTPSPPNKGLPIKAEWIENQIVITASNDTSLFQKGDIVKSIDGIDSKKILEKTERLVSGSPQLKRYRALNIFDGGTANSEANIELIRNNETLNIKTTRNEFNSLFFNNIVEFDFPGIKKLDSNIYYINLTAANARDYINILDELKNAKGIIFDQRFDGKYDKNWEHINFTKHIIPHITKETVFSTTWLVPQIIYPDRDKLDFEKSKWSIKPAAPYFNAKIVFINVPSVVSSGETYMGIIDHYELAEKVGEATAGCNGNANYIFLPGGFNIMWTGMKVVKHDGSQLHLVGFKPDYPVNKTIKAVKEGRDEYLEKAIEIINQVN